MSDSLTTEVEQIVGVPFWVLHQMIRSRKISKPSKDTSGNLRWTEKNIQEVKAVLARAQEPREAAHV